MISDPDLPRKLIPGFPAAQLDEVQNVVAVLGKKLDHALIVGINPVVGRTSAQFMREAFGLAVQLGCDPLPSEFFFNRDRFHPDNIPIDAADHVTEYAGAILLGDIDRELFRQVFLQLNSGASWIALRWSSAQPR